MVFRISERLHTVCRRRPFAAPSPAASTYGITRPECCEYQALGRQIDTKATSQLLFPTSQWRWRSAGALPLLGERLTNAWSRICQGDHRAGAGPREDYPARPGARCWSGGGMRLEPLGVISRHEVREPRLPAEQVARNPPRIIVSARTHPRDRRQPPYSLAAVTARRCSYRVAVVLGATEAFAGGTMTSTYATAVPATSTGSPRGLPGGGVSPGRSSTCRHRAPATAGWWRQEPPSPAATLIKRADLGVISDSTEIAR